MISLANKDHNCIFVSGFQGCSDRCDEFKACVQCQMYGTGPIESKEECLRVCTKFTPESVKVVQGKPILPDFFL